jgi:hypothetical protein
VSPTTCDAVLALAAVAAPNRPIVAASRLPPAWPRRRTRGPLVVIAYETGLVQAGLT